MYGFWVLFMMEARANLLSYALLASTLVAPLAIVIYGISRGSVERALRLALIVSSLTMAALLTVFFFAPTVFSERLSNFTEDPIIALTVAVPAILLVGAAVLTWRNLTTKIRALEVSIHDIREDIRHDMSVRQKPLDDRFISAALPVGEAKSRTSKSMARRYTIKIVLAYVAFVLILVGSLYFLPMFFYDVHWLMRAVLFILVVSALSHIVYTTLPTLYRHQTASMRHGAQEELVRDPRIPVVLLRSFFDDYASLQSTSMDYERVSLEEHLGAQATELGPFIAIGSPEEKIAPIGAYRTYFEGEVWREVIPNWVEATPLIIFMVGASDGAAWEIEKIIERGALSRTIFVFPGPEHIRGAPRGDAMHQLRRSWFEQVLSHVGVDKNVAEALSSSTAFLTIPDNGSPVVVNVPTRNDLAYTVGFEISYYSLFCGR